MVDKKNLNRVKGILSARKGAEIPKYEGGNKIVLPAFNPGDASFQQWRSKATRAPSSYLSAWREYSILKSEFPTASIDDLASYMDSGVGPGNVTLESLYSKYTDAPPKGTKPAATVPGANPNVSIPGDPNLTPNTAIENAAGVNAKVADKKEQAIVEEQATNQRPPVQPVPEPPKINIPPASIYAKKENPIEIESKQQLEQEKAKVDKKEQNWNKFGEITTAAFQGIGNAIGAKQAATDSTLTKGIDTAYNTASDMVEKLGPVGKVVGTAMKFAGTAGNIIQAMGGGTDQMTAADKWMDSALFSWNIGMLNGFGGKKSDNFSVDQSIVSQVGSSYGGSVEDMNDAASKAGKKYGLFSSGARKRANKAIAEAKTTQNLMGNIADSANDDRMLVQSMSEQQGLANTLAMNGGYNQKYTYAAKHGGLLEWNPTEILEWQPQVELNWELPAFKEGGNIDIVEELEWIPEFKSGGKAENFDIPKTEETSQKNVIPEGALHKNKHRMEHADGLTKKGIPVIDENGEQQAEIEHSEIIFTLEVTKKLEEYYEAFYSDESSNKEKEQAALDAGKLLVYQILENTEDRTGLIESCKEGGSLTLKTTTDDLIKEISKEIPTMVVIEEVIETSKKKDKKSDKELMKEAIKEALIELLIK